MQYALFPILAAIVLLAGCRSYTQSTSPEFFEDDSVANFRRVFMQEVPEDVTVLNSVVVGYSWRPGVVTSHDFEFEMLASERHIAAWQKKFYLRKGQTFGVEERKMRPIREWYAPKPFAEYEPYRDASSAGYVHMLVDRTPEPDGRRRVFVSKH
jgi:hypothetical protein